MPGPQPSSLCILQTGEWRHMDSTQVKILEREIGGSQSQNVPHRGGGLDFFLSYSTHDHVVTGMITREFVRYAGLSPWNGILPYLLVGEPLTRFGPRISQSIAITSSGLTSSGFCSYSQRILQSSISCRSTVKRPFRSSSMLDLAEETL